MFNVQMTEVEFIVYVHQYLDHSYSIQGDLSKEGEDSRSAEVIKKAVKRQAF